MSSTTAAPATLEQVVNDRPVSALQIRAIMLCSLVVFVDGYDLQAMALVVNSLSDAWYLPASAFGLAQAASAIGLAIGSIFLAPLGDKRGRKPIVFGGLLLMGSGSLMLMTATETAHLVIWRCCVGIGLGMCHGNATALGAEFAPLRKRALLMTLMGCNVALGGLVAGLMAPWLLAHWGWRSVFFVGGAVPLLVAFVVRVAVPESLQFLFARQPAGPRIAKLLNAIAPGVNPTMLVASVGRNSPTQSVFALLKPPLLERTLRLWLIYAFNTFLLYLLISWLPVFLSGAGWSRTASSHGIVMLQLGGICGAVLLSYLVDRGHAVNALIAAYLTCAATALLFVVLPSEGWSWNVLIVLLGASISGALLALMTLGAIFYPTTIRATGFSWTAAVARTGAILGPLAGAWVLKAGIPSTKIIALLAVPAAISALIALSMRRIVREATAEELRGS